MTPEAQRSGAAGVRLTYHEPCHLANVQGVRRQPRALLARLKNRGVDVRELNDPTRCCGSAGIYNVLEREMSAQILQHKMEAVNATGAGIVATANPGCMLQLASGARLHGSRQRVMHVVEILDQAYRNF